MAGSRPLATSRSGDFRADGHRGNPVPSFHSQLGTLLRSRLGERHARLLAEPLEIEESGDIEWHTEVEGATKAFAACSADERARLEAEYGRLRADVERLQGELGRGDATAQNWSELLGRVLASAAPEKLHLVGDQPVLVEWGVQREGALAGAARLTQSGAAPPAPPDQKGGGAGDGGSTDASPKRRFPWWIPLLLLALALAAWASQCGSDVCLDHEPVAPVLDDRREDRRAERDRLRDELERRRRACESPSPSATPTETPTPLDATETPTPTPTEIAEQSPTPTSTQKAASSPKPTKSPRPTAEKPTPGPKPTGAAKQARCEGELPKDRQGKVVFVVDASASMRFWYGIDRVQEQFFSLMLQATSGSRNEFIQKVDAAAQGRPRRMDLSREAIKNVYPSLPDSITIGLVEFGTVDPSGQEGCGVRSHGFFPSHNRNAFWNRVRAINPMGATPTSKGIEAATKMLAGTSAEEGAAMIIVTDGQESCGGEGSACNAAKRAKSAIPNLQVAVIDLAGYPANRCIADATGGKLYAPTSVAAVAANVKTATVESLRDPECRK